MDVPGSSIRLSRREREVAALVAEGLTDREIAERLFVSRRTAEGHVQAIRNKLGLDNRSQIAAWQTRRALAGSAERPSRLPVQITSFVGRQRELAELGRLLERSRLVTVTGPGGAGKTRLALRLAQDQEAAFPGGVWFVDLSQLGSLDLVPQALAAALDVREPASGDLLAGIVERLGQGRCLVVMDNCEHLIERCAELAHSLLRACARLSLLCTSREPLLVDGEAAWSLAPLSLPAEAGSRPTDIAAAEAVQLFCERVSHSDPSFALDEANSVLVAGLCGRLDGIPLALELAAAQVGQFGLEGVLARLSERVDFLHRRGAPGRQQTLNEAVGWSYELLEEPERRLFRRLAVFRGGFDDAAVTAVCGEGAERLPRLAEKSLLVPLRGGRRWRLLETIRQVAEELLLASGESARLEAAHLAHFLDVAERAETELSGPGQGARLQELEEDHDNLRAALRASQGHDAEQRLRLVVALHRFWLLRGHLSEARGWLEQALAAAGGTSVARARALNAAAGIAWRQGDYADARAHLEQSLAVWRALEEVAGVQRCLGNLGVIASSQGDFEAARTYYRESLELAQRGADPRAVAIIQSNLGLAAAELGAFEEAAALLAGGLAAVRSLEEPALIGATLVNLGILGLNQGEVEAARTHFEEALEILAAIGDTADAAGCLEGLGWLAALEGRPGRAVQLAGAASAVREGIGAPGSPAARRRVERWLPEAREALGGEAAAAWEAGRALSVAEAIELGRETAG